MTQVLEYLQLWGPLTQIQTLSADEVCLPIVHTWEIQSELPVIFWLLYFEPMASKSTHIRTDIFDLHIYSR